MDKIRQAIERARAERGTPTASDGPTSAATTASSRTSDRAAAIPFEPDRSSLAAARILPSNDAGAAAKAVRLLRTIVIQRLRERNWRTIGVVSARRNDGKSALAGNLAVAIGTDPRCTSVLVDLDVDSPWLSEAFSTPSSPGLSACLFGEAALEDCVFAPVGYGRLEVVPLCAAGTAVDPALVALPGLRDELDALRAREDAIVVVDLPAVLDSDAALTAASFCDALIFTVREGVTARADLERALGLLAAVPVLGTVLIDSLTAPGGEPVEA